MEVGWVESVQREQLGPSAKSLPPSRESDKCIFVAATMTGQGIKD